VDVLHDFGIFRTPGGEAFHARACGVAMDDGLWHGWLEFEPLEGGGAPVLRSPRETTQPNRTDAVYWATGLSAVYLEGALERAIRAETEPAPLTVADLDDLSTTEP